MNLREMYETAIQLGRQLDPRGEAGIERQLTARRREYESLPEWRRRFYDVERLRNPFGDVRIVHGPDGVEIKAILVGINIHMPEFLLADQLRTKGVKLDAIVSHHTNSNGVSASLVDDIMEISIDVFEQEGVPRVDAERLFRSDMAERFRAHDDFHKLGPEMARLLGFPMAVIHSPADYFANQGLMAVFERESVRTVEDIIRVLLTIPEFQSSARIGAVPRLLSGREDSPAGRLFMQYSGGWLYPPEAQLLLGKAGVNTTLYIGATSAVATASEEAGIACIRLPHAATDNLGINLLLDAIERIHGPLEVIGCNCFERVKRS